MNTTIMGKKPFREVPRKCVMLLAALAMACLCANAQPLTPQANEDVELMGILSRMAGFPEYRMDVAGQYIKDIDSCFKDYTEHPAVLRMKELRNTYGIAYDAVMSMALHLRKDGENFSLVTEETSTLDARWDKVDKAKFLGLLADFYRDSRFHLFFERHQEVYEKGIRAYDEEVARHLDINWYESFYGNKPEERYAVIIGFCNGHGNYGVNRHAKGKEKEVFAIVGYSVDQKNQPQYSKEYLSTLVHEFNHSFVNSLLDGRKHPDHVKALEQAGSFLYLITQATMRQQAYGTWQTMINESLVRAAVICYMMDKGYAPEEVRNELLVQIQRDFRWTPELVRLLRRYEKKRKRYANLESFYPKIIRFFSDYAEKEYKRLDIMD
ncbi:MAG: DUF4932 domain-containing protein [Prevotella sp.]|nr:DUF4932 domain-containing protein [Prevotella sp.]